MLSGQRNVPAALPPINTRYPLNRRLGVFQGRSGRVRKISPPPGFDPLTVQSVASRYTDTHTNTHIYIVYIGTLVRELQTHEWAQRHAPTAYLSGLLVHFIICFLSLCSRREALTACRFSQVSFPPGVNKALNASFFLSLTVAPFPWTSRNCRKDH